ncbi:MAG: Ig-like domain-containing protein, partial [Pseudomonadota bacterium]
GDGGVSLPTADAFSDVDTANLTYSATGLPPGLSIDAATGEITGTIDSSASQGGNGGVYSVTVSASDGVNRPATQTFSWTVTNPAPVAVDDSATTDEDTPVDIAVLNNDSDPDLDALTIVSAVASVGQATVVGNVVRYTPPANFNGRATISYTISDGEGGTSTATVTVDVTPANDDPIATQLPGQDVKDGDAIAFPAGDAFSDVDGDDLTFSASDLPPGLSIDPDTGIISGTIDNEASQTNGGVYEVTITANDGNGGTVTQTVTFNVTNPGPDAVNDTATTGEDTPIILSPLANDSDPDGDDLTIVNANADNGTVVINPDGTVTYTPNPNFNGTDTITYEISDGNGGSDIATIAVTVLDENDVPISTGTIEDQTNLDGQPIDLPVGAVFFDSDGDALSFNATGLPPGLTIDPVTGTISGMIDNSASQIDGGVYSVTVIADDGRGGTVSETFSWTVTNPAPVAANDTANTNEDTAIRIDVLANDPDPDGDDLTVIEAEAGSGTVTINADGSLVYTPDANFNGTDTIIYTIDDGEGGISSASVTVTVDAVNDAPTTVGLANQNGEDGQAVTISTAQAFDDVDGDDLSFAADGLPPSLSIDPDTGVISGTLASDASQNGPFVVTVTATDPSGASVSTTFVYSIQNVPPVAVNDTATTMEDTPVTVAVLANDSDPDGDPLTIIEATSPDGTVTINPDGTLTFDPADDLNGPAVVSYTVSDGQGGLATATLTIDVEAVNDAPEAEPIPDITNEDNQSVSVSVGEFFSDLDGDTLAFDATGLPPGLTIDQATGIISGTIDRDASQVPDGEYPVTITADDGNGGTIQTSFTWTITNPAPTAFNDAATTTEDTPVDIVVLDNDVDPDGDPLVVTGAVAANGTVTVNADGTLSYLPDTDFNGEDTIIYTIEDGNGGSSTAAVIVTVTPENDAPVATDDTAATIEDTPVTIGVLGNDSDVDGDELTITSATSPDGDVTINPDGTVTFSPAPNFNGTTTVTYEISDGNGGTDTATVTVTVGAVNDPPVAQDDAATTDEDSPVNISPLANDSDADGDPLTITSANADNGSVTVNPDGTLTYTPDDDFNGTDTISYTISDGQGGFDTAEITITVNPQNDAPVAAPIGQQSADDADVVSVDVSPAFGDVDGDDLSFMAAGLPPGLSIDPVTGEISGTVDPSASQGGPTGDGVYTVIVTADDGNGGTVDQVFTWVVANPGPMAGNDLANTTEDNPVIIAPLDNDTDPDGDPLTIADASAQNGSVAINTDGTVTYTPDPNFNGTDTITYTISDGEGGTDTATITVEVTPENDAPTIAAPPADISTQDGDTLNLPVGDVFADVDGDVLTFSATGLPAGLAIDPNTGEITGTIDNQASQISGGIYTVTVTADDGNGGTVDATFIIDVANPPPLAQDDTASTNEDTAVTVDVLGNDSDPDGDPLMITDAAAANGSVSINPDGTLTYTPDPDFNGTDVVTYTISDGNGGTSVATLTVIVDPQNDAPVVDIPLVNRGNADADVVSLDLSDEFSDVDGNTLTFSASGLPSGLVIDPATGIVSGTIDPSASQLNGGVYTVTITADDGNGGVTSTNFSWVVTNPGPDAVDDAASTNEDMSVDIAVLANDADPDGDALSVTAASATNGTVTLNGDGSLTYTPDPDFNGTDTITYTITDGEGGTDTAIVAVTVGALNDGPIVDAPLADQSNDDADVVSVETAGSFSDVDGDTLTFSATGLPTGLSIDSTTGEISGTIDPSASQVGSGVYEITVTADDGNGGSVSSTFDWTIANPAPVAADDTASTTEDNPVVISPLANDSDPDGDALTIVTANSDNGTIVINADGTLTYQPDGNFNGSDTIIYTISDGEGGTDTAVITVTVAAENDAPETLGLPDLFDSNSEVISVPLAPAFTDAESDALTFSATGLPAGLSIDPATGLVSGTISATASSDVPNGEYTVTVTADDGNGGTVSTTFTWTITNEPPRAINDTTTTTEDTPVVIDVLANDIDPDGDPNTPIVIVSADATNGTAIINSDGTIRFTPEPDFNGVATVTYTIEDANGELATAVATITVTPENDAPSVAILPDLTALDSDAITENFGVFFSDVEGDTLTFSANGLPAGLSINPATGEVSGTIDPDASQINGGVYSVTISADDGNGGVTDQTFIWRIGNPRPSAAEDTASTTEDTPVNIAPLANDNDPDGDALTITAATAPNGEVTINPDGTVTYTPDPDFNGVDTISYTIDDGQGGTDTAVITVTVGSENDDPIADPLPARANVDGAAIDLPLGDGFNDVDGDALTFSATGLPAGLSIDSASGVVTGTIDANASQGGPASDGIYSVTITADDGNGGTVSTGFNWTVTNPPPVAVDDGPVSVTEDNPADINVLANDTDPDSDPLNVVEADAGNGTVTINPDGSLTYTPDENYNGPDTITYTISDGNGGTSTATVDIDVIAVNDDPTVLPAPARTNADGAFVSVPVGNNFDDPDGDGLAFSAVGLPPGLTIDPATGLISGTIDPSASQGGPGGDGIYLVEVTADDGNGGTVSTAFAWTVVNPPPEAVNDTASTDEDTIVNIDVLANDLDPDGDPLTVIQASAGNGTVAILPDGTIDYTPNPDFNGTDTITYTISDGNGGTSTATVAITVAPVNDDPVATDDVANTDEDTPITIPVLANDSDPDGDPLTVIDATAPNGTVTINPDGTVTYTPDPDFNGTDTITYTVSDGNGGTTTATVTVEVEPVNDDPVAVDDAITTDEDSPTIIPVLANDSDPDGDPLTVTQATSPDGTVTINPDGSVTFAPDPDFNGPTTVTYTISDGNGGTSTASVTVDVTPVADDPVAQDDAITIDEDSPAIIPALANDSDPDGDPLMITQASANNGIVTINPDGTLLYTPDPDFNGTDVITYTVSDGNGGFETATVTVTVEPVNDAPALGPDSATTLEDQPVTVPVLANDTDVDGDPLTITQASSPNGDVTINPDGTITFTPDPDFNGPTTITYTVSDGNGGTTTTTVTVDVVAVNDPPVVNDDAAVTDEDNPLTLPLLGNATDPDGDPLVIAEASAPNGTVTLNPDGTVTYTPDPDFNGTDIITYVVSDGNGGFTTATVTVTVNPVNDDPVAQDDRASTDEEVPITITVLANDNDADGDPLTVTEASAPNGTVTINADGTITYVPDDDFFGADTVTYTVSDGNGGTSTATVAVNVANVNEPPIDEDETVVQIGPDPLVINVLANATDPDGDPLSIFSARTDLGTVVISPDGTLTFTAPPGVDGVATITYIVSDGHGGFVESTATVTIIQAAADINQLLALDDFSYPPLGERYERFTGETARFLRVPLIVDQTANEFRTLNPTVFLEGDRPLLDAIDAIEPLRGFGGLNPVGLPVTDVVDYIETIIDFRFGADRLFDPRFGDFTFDTLTGFSARQLETGSDRVMIESVVRDRAIYVEMSDVGLENEARVTEFQLFTRTGEPLPDWIRMDSRGLAIIERPANADELRLIVRALFADGGYEDIFIRVQGETGEIQIDSPLGELGFYEMQTLKTRLAASGVMSDAKTQELMSAFS